MNTKINRDTQPKDMWHTLMRECPTCNQTYPADSMKLMSTYSDRVHLVHTICPSCQSMFLACVTLSPLGASAIAMPTDLDPHDVDRLVGSEPISEDDLLALHALIKKNAIVYT